MIEKIEIKNYGNISIEAACSGITILAGPNGIGKSMIAEAMRRIGAERERAYGKGAYIRQHDDIRSGTSIKITTGKKEYGIRYVNGDRCVWTCSPGTDGDPGRINVRIIRPAPEPRAACELRAALLERAPEDLMADSTGYTVIDQVDHWMKKIVGTGIMERTMEPGHRELVCYREAGGPAIRLKNAGTGVMTLTNLLTGCFLSDAGDILFIEHPEVFLHPGTQSRLFGFFLFLAKNGRQVFLETHSDHIVNAARVNICQKNARPEDVAINYMHWEGPKIENSQVRISDHGKLISDGTLEGFFDQYEKDFDIMIGI